MSKGELIVKRYLDKKGISYVQEKQVGNTRMRFDFFLDELNIVIEYQGKQHYEPVKIYGGWKGLEDQQERDCEKRQYCRDHLIGLIEVPYYIPDIEDYLNRRIELIKVWRM